MVGEQVPYVMNWDLFFQGVSDGIQVGVLACFIAGLTGFVVSKFIRLMKGGV